MCLQALERTSLSLCNDTQKIAGSGTAGRQPWSVGGNEPQRRWGARTRVPRTSLQRMPQRGHPALNSMTR